MVADFDSGTRQIVDHLASYGHRSFVFAGGPAESWSGARRWHGLQAAAAENGDGDPRFGPYMPTLGGGPAAADAALASGATAVVCHNDMLAIGVMRRLAERGLRVPDDVSVVGFDDIFGADFCHPPLTTLAERTDDAGARAVEVLVQQLPTTDRGRGTDAGAADPPGRARLDRSGAGQGRLETPGARRQCPAAGRPTPSRVSRAARRGSRPVTRSPGLRERDRGGRTDADG